MKSEKETKEERFIRLAEARVNKILSMLHLLGNLSGINYAYTMDQVEQIFTRIQLDLVKTKMRFLQPASGKKHRFLLGKPYVIEGPSRSEQNPAFVIPLPDGSYLRAVGYPNDSYPSITIYWDAQENPSDDGICFAEFNPDKDGVHRLCIGVYCAEEEETKYYGPYITAERNYNGEYPSVQSAED